MVADYLPFFVFKTDQTSYDYFTSKGHPAFLVKPHRQDGSADEVLKPVKYGTVQYQELILQRTKLVNRVLQLGYNILLCDIDAVWLSDPTQYLSHSYEVQAQPEADGRLCGGFMFWVSTAKVRKFYQAVTDKHEELVTRARQKHKLKSVDESEQEIILKMIGSAGLKVKKLDSNKFPHGLKYFGHGTKGKSLMDLTKYTPVVVHNNYIIGKDNKLIRFKRAKLWFISGSTKTGFTCSLD